MKKLIWDTEKNIYLIEQQAMFRTFASQMSKRLPTEWGNPAALSQPLLF
jgi:hypothetical protein